MHKARENEARPAKLHRAGAVQGKDHPGSPAARLLPVLSPTYPLHSSASPQWEASAVLHSCLLSEAPCDELLMMPEEFACNICVGGQT